jgi:hypothetical protein
MRKMSLGCLLSLLVLSAPLAQHASPGIAGKWSGAIDLTAGGQTNRVLINCEFRMQGQAVSGTFALNPDTPLKFDGGTFDGAALAFRVTAPTRLYKFSLAVADKNRVTGGVESEDGKATGVVVIARQVAEAYTRDDWPEFRSRFLGQHAPGTMAERFAPGIVSVAGVLDSVPQFTTDGEEVYWSRVGPEGGIFFSRVEDGRWTLPERMPWAVVGERDMIPVLFAGGQKMLVHSTRALPDGRKPQPGFFSFWVATRQEPTWSASLTPIDFFYTGKDDFSTIGDDGTLYLGPERGVGLIRRATLADGRYGKPQTVSTQAGGFPVLAGPKGDYLVIADGQPNRDLSVLFRRNDGSFTAPISLGPTVNGPATEMFASLSPDGRYFFFCSDRTGDFEVYWVDAGFLEGLRKKAGL